MSEDRWSLSAACRNHPNLGWWYPVTGAGRGYPYAKARAVCDSCPVAEQCLAHAIDTNETSGMWGGWTPEERRKGERIEARKPSGRGKGIANGDGIRRNGATDEQRRQLVWLVQHDGMRVGTAAAKVRVSETTARKLLRQAGYPQAAGTSDPQPGPAIIEPTTETGHEAASTAPVALEQTQQEVYP